MASSLLYDHKATLRQVKSVKCDHPEVRHPEVRPLPRRRRRRKG